MTRFAYAFVLAALLVGCGSQPSGSNSAEVSNSPTSKPGANVPDLAKLETKTLTEGTGKPAKAGDLLIVLYTGKLKKNGALFDSNMDDSYKALSDKDPFSLVLGAGQVIKGWDEGLVGIKSGEVRQIDIPWSMGYGVEGSGDKIPPKADLSFVVKVLKIYPVGIQPEIEAKDIKVGSGKKVTMQSTVTFTYKGTTLGGKVFDDETKKPLTFPVSRLIPGFKDALLGMMPGGQRKISWPPGAPNPTGLIPPNQPLEYVVDMIDVK